MSKMDRTVQGPPSLGNWGVGLIPSLICLSILVAAWDAQAQWMPVNGLYGQTGIAISPTAEVQTDRLLTGGWQMVPRGHAHLNYSRRNDVGEHCFFARIGFLPRLEASIRLTHPMVPKGEYGIGDRSVFLKFQALREKRFAPALSVGVYDPMGTKLLPAVYAVASKSFPMPWNRSLRTTLGYGARVLGDVNYLLEGFWVGAQYLPAGPPRGLWPQWGVGAEYVRGQFNLSATLQAFSFLQVNAWLLDLRGVGVGVTASVAL